jgi:DNA-nicking Smr family endonuclease
MSRRLTEDERAIWDRVARTARRLQRASDPGPDLRLSPVPDAEAAPLRPLPGPRAILPSRAPSPPGQLSGPRVVLDLARPLDQVLAEAPVRLDAGLHRRMVRGKLSPESRIDLHGMTRAQAQPALTGFLLSAQARGLRLVLVITGKGRERDDDDHGPMPRRPGALRHDLPHWVQSPPLRAIVLDLRPAHRSHGGGGAFYVYLRRRG